MQTENETFMSTIIHYYTRWLRVNRCSYGITKTRSDGTTEGVKHESMELRYMDLRSEEF